VSGAFLAGYAALRFLAEFARQPDAFLGFPLPGITMGQILCVPMFVAGLWLIRRARSAG
jgi:phosphatidylglycerol:prolipoprotein diacylglycerol transferase